MKPAADYRCACGHPLSQHDRPAGSRQPWGGCSALTQDDKKISRCPCLEAWPVEDDEEPWT